MIDNKPWAHKDHQNQITPHKNIIQESLID